MAPEEISMKRMAQVKTRHRGDTDNQTQNRRSFARQVLGPSPSGFSARMNRLYQTTIRKTGVKIIVS
jgi:hypothetical protein